MTRISYVFDKPVTPDSLLAIAAEAKAQIGSMTGDSPDAWKARSDIRRILEQASMAAEWMNAQGIKEAVYVGPFGPKIDINRGDRIRLKTGIRVTSTSNRLCTEATKRARVVNAWNVNEGWVGRGQQRGEIEVRNPQFHWVGTNSYWCWTDMTNVEGKVPAKVDPDIAN